MAGDNNLKILITGQLNTGASIGSINASLKGLEKKVNALKLNVQVNDKVLGTLKQFNEQMKRISDAALNTGKVIEEALMPDGSKIKRTYFNGLKGEFSETIRAAKDSATKQLASLDEVAKGWDKVTREVEKYNSAQKKTSGSTTLSNAQGTTSRTINTNADGNVLNYRDTYNYAKDEQQTQKLIAEKEKLRQELVKLGETGNVTAQQLANVARVVNGVSNLNGVQNAKQAYLQLAENAKLAEQMAQGREKASIASQQADMKLNTTQAQQVAKNDEITRQLQQQLQLYQKQAGIQANTLLNNSKKMLNDDQKTSLQNYLNSVNQLSTSTPQVQQRMRELALEFKDISSQAMNAHQHTMTFANSLKMAFTIMPGFMIANSIMMAPVRALQDMTQRLIQIDTQMTEIRRVMDEPDYKFVDMLQAAVDTSDQLSSKLTDVLDIMGGFGRMGFSDTQLVDITKTAQVLQNISDLDQNGAVDTLTSAMLNFNIAAKDSISISDKLNEVKSYLASLYSNIQDKWCISVKVQRWIIPTEALFGNC